MSLSPEERKALTTATGYAEGLAKKVPDGDPKRLADAITRLLKRVLSTQQEERTV
jgi:hypothetical protein